MILNPVGEGEERSAAWVADVFSRLAGPGFRVPRPIRARPGSWLASGWSAWVAVASEPGAVRHWDALSRAAAPSTAPSPGSPVPAWLGQETNPWTEGDRAAWGRGVPVVPGELRGQVETLFAALRPVALPAQLIHGDLEGNMLFAPGLPPAVIDFAPYRRPAGFALASAAADALTWSGAQPSPLDALAGEPELDQLLARALIYRLVTEGRPGAATGSPSPPCCGPTPPWWNLCSGVWPPEWTRRAAGRPAVDGPRRGRAGAAVRFG